MEEFNYDNEIIEVNEETSNMSLEELIKNEAERKDTEDIKEPKKKKRRSLKEIINNLSKKKRITIIVISIVILLLIIGLVLFFLLKSDKEEKPEEPTIVIEKDNYRYENGTLIFLNKNEKEIGRYECTNKDVDKCYVTKIDLSNDTFDVIKSVYENGEEIIKTSKIYNDKYVFVTDGDIINLYNIIDKNNELELNNIKVYSTSRDLVIIENDKSLYGLIEIKEDGYEYIIRPSYDNLGIVNNEEYLLLAQDKDKHYIIDIDGKVLSKDIKVDVKSANKSYIVGLSNDSYSLYSYDYEEVLSDYDYIGLHDNIISLVKSKKLYLLNDKLNKLYEDGIRLSSTDYNKKYVYDDNNKLIETKKSYEIEVKNNEVNITIDKDIKKINLLEGEYSSTLSYMSYFDGKLYFYGDEEKIDVIGTYNCNNKNSISSIEDGLKNCYLYTDSLGISGIYNNEYVLVHDASNNEIIYYLYNLKEKKVKGTYSEIRIVNESELNTNVKPIYTSSSYIIAMSATGSNKGNYGVLEINSDKVQGKIGFKYQSIEKNNDYYLLLNVDNTYSIYNKEFTKVSNEFEYIKMYDKYYVGINNKKLNVYSYTDTLGILENDLSVSSNDFKIDFTDGFTITIDNKEYKYDKLGKEVVDKVDSEGENNEE